ncbi:MAG TPA: hypothetical protein VL096_12950 [Pirellulaceae bacterium]|nr:hypothetical protein [Pirellulaceae bacterium]
MRYSVLAVLSLLLIASPALAQGRISYGPSSPRASYQPRASQVNYRTKTVTNTHVDNVIASHGYGGYGDGSGGCPCGHPPRVGRNCCPGIFPDVIDNFWDGLICLVPTRAHCCPYPHVDTSHHRQGSCGCPQPRFKSLFPCSKGGCQKSSCSSCTTSAPSCGCTTKAGAETWEHLSPPQPEPETPFKDDPAEMPMQRGATKKSKYSAPKTTATSPGWYKTVRPAPITAANRQAVPRVMVVGTAAPITIDE